MLIHSDRANYLTAAAWIEGELRRRIQGGKLRPGARLVLAPIAGEFDVSITPVREALGRLGQEGLVVHRPSSGYRVARPDVTSLVGLWNVREALECQAARLCARKARKFEIAELEELARRADKVMGKRTRDETDEIAFHTRVAAIAGYAELSDDLVRVVNLLGTFSQPRINSRVTHMRVVRAIASGDADRADKTMRAHVHCPTEDDLEP